VIPEPSDAKTPPVRPGDVLRLNEADYMYGRGFLILRVTKVGRLQRLPDGVWLDLEGLQLRTDGTQMWPQPRHALVRLSAIRGRPPAVDRHE
jgi:hypothetical protein